MSWISTIFVSAFKSIMSLQNNLNCNNVTTILKKIGTMREVEDLQVEGRLIKTFIRARVSLNIAKPLPVGC